MEIDDDTKHKNPFEHSKLKLIGILIGFLGVGIAFLSSYIAKAYGPIEIIHLGTVTGFTLCSIGGITTLIGFFNS